VPEYSVIDIAFLYEDTEHLERVLESDIGEELNQRLVDEFGIRVLAYNWYGLPRYIMHRSRFVEGPGDVADVRTRAPTVPMYIANWENIGAVPVQIAYGEQYLALRQGVVEMTESSAHTIYGMKLHEVAPFITEADMMYPQNSVFVSEAALQALSPEDRELVTQAATDAGIAYADMMRDAFVSERESIVAEGGQFQRMSDETRETFASMVEEAIPDMVAEGLIPEGWYERIAAMRDN
jgi:TRAP-type C4-dicarboxylate transport system substrate-binding protein